MKVYCAFKFRPFEPNELVGIAKTEKKALEILKREFPYMRGSIERHNLVSDKNETYLLQIIPMEVEE